MAGMIDKYRLGMFFSFSCQPFRSTLNVNETSSWSLDKNASKHQFLTVNNPYNGRRFTFGYGEGRLIGYVLLGLFAEDHYALYFLPLGLSKYQCDRASFGIDCRCETASFLW